MSRITNDMIEKWLKGWSLSRKLPLPVKYRSGFKVEVGEEKQKIRYVFSELNDDFLNLSKITNEPWIHLKVCVPPDEVKEVVPERWKIQPPGYMMSCFQPMKNPDSVLYDGYRLEYERYNSALLLKIIAENGDLACSGHVVLVDDFAVYDRIVTEEKHRRKGLATFLMHELERNALANGISNNFLVATKEGKALYESIGWELYSPYTSIVIPGID